MEHHNINKLKAIIYIEKDEEFTEILKEDLYSMDGKELNLTEYIDSVEYTFEDEFKDLRLSEGINKIIIDFKQDSYINSHNEGDYDIEILKIEVFESSIEEMNKNINKKEKLKISKKEFNIEF